MSADTFEFDDKNHAERFVGTLHDPAATPGDVLTVQADKSIAAAPGGGSMPDQFSGFGSPVICNQSYTVTLNGSPDGGYCTLVEPTIFDEGTDQIAFDADGDAVAAAFVSNFGSGNVVASGPAGGPWTITFIGIAEGEAVTLTLETNSLTNGGDPVADPTVASLQEGGVVFSAPADAVYFDAQSRVMYFNNGDEGTPDWQGTSSLSQQGIYNGDQAGIAAQAIGMFDWVAGPGDALLDLTTPDAPTVLADGLYAFSVEVNGNQADANGGVYTTLVVGGFSLSQGCPYYLGNGGTAAVTLVAKCAAGDTVQLAYVNSGTSDGVELFFQMCVVKIA